MPTAAGPAGPATKPVPRKIPPARRRALVGLGSGLLALVACAPRPFTPAETSAEWQRTQGANLREQARAETERIRSLPPAEQWTVTCQPPDTTRGTVFCYMRSPPLGAGLYDNLRVEYIKSHNGQLIGPLIGTHNIHNCPGRSMVVRVDANPPNLVPEPFNDASQAALRRAVEQMRTGKTVRIEQRAWPECVGLRSEFSLAGFGDAYPRFLQAVRDAKVQ